MNQSKKTKKKFKSQYNNYMLWFHRNKTVFWHKSGTSKFSTKKFLITGTGGREISEK